MPGFHRRRSSCLGLPSPRASRASLASLAAGLAAVALTATIPAQVRADASSDVTITLNEDGKRLAQELGLDLETFEQDLETKATGALQLSEVQRFLRSFANASSFSNRGIGVDYASNSERYVLGLAANLAVSADLGGDDDVPTVGVAPNFTLMGGMNLRRWKHPELTVFANLFHYDADSGALHGGITSLGLHAQYKLFSPTSGVARHFARWGGLDFTGGVEITHWDLGLGGDLSHSFDVGAEGGASSEVTAAIGGRFDLAATTVTMPIEVTTNVRLLYVLGLYAGAGLDVQVGAAEIAAGTSGSLRATRPGAPEMMDTIGEVAASAEGSNSPSALGYHLLFGAQLNLWRLKIFTQATLRPVSDVSVAAGMRVVL